MLFTGMGDDCCALSIAINYNVSWIFAITSKLTFVSSRDSSSKSHSEPERETN